VITDEIYSVRNGLTHSEIGEEDDGDLLLFYVRMLDSRLAETVEALSWLSLFTHHRKDPEAMARCCFSLFTHHRKDPKPMARCRSQSHQDRALIHLKFKDLYVKRTAGC
jgi:hypothetical protein